MVDEEQRARKCGVGLVHECVTQQISDDSWVTPTQLHTHSNVGVAIKSSNIVSNGTFSLLPSSLCQTVPGGKDLL